MENINFFFGWRVFVVGQWSSVEFSVIKVFYFGIGVLGLQEMVVDKKIENWNFIIKQDFSEGVRVKV